MTVVHRNGEDTRTGTDHPRERATVTVTATATTEIAPGIATVIATEIEIETATETPEDTTSAAVVTTAAAAALPASVAGLHDPTPTLGTDPAPLLGARPDRHLDVEKSAATRGESERNPARKRKRRRGSAALPIRRNGRSKIDWSASRCAVCLPPLMDTTPS